MASNQSVQQQAASAIPPQLSMPGTTGAQLQSNSTSAIAKALVAIWSFIQSIMQAFNALQGCGYIVSIVTNSNGTAVLYSNGWMECYATLSVTTTESGGALSYAGYFTWTFPVAFASAPFLAAPMVASPSTFGYSVIPGPATNLSTTSAVVYVYMTSNETPAVDVAAQGYWR